MANKLNLPPEEMGVPQSGGISKLQILLAAVVASIGVQIAENIARAEESPEAPPDWTVQEDDYVLDAKIQDGNVVGRRVPNPLGARVSGKTDKTVNAPLSGLTQIVQKIIEGMGIDLRAKGRQEGLGYRGKLKVNMEKDGLVIFAPELLGEIGIPQGVELANGGAVITGKLGGGKFATSVETGGRTWSSQSRSVTPPRGFGSNFSLTVRFTGQYNDPTGELNGKLEIEGEGGMLAPLTDGEVTDGIVKMAFPGPAKAAKDTGRKPATCDFCPPSKKR